MTHILLDESIVPVETEHGDVHVGTGNGRIVIAVNGPETSDIHLTAPQALALIREVLTAISRVSALTRVMNRKRAAA